ncbi:hypothetical protein RJT34_09060 [Clitoria ternatea]|uniref:Uncharacterized protein n=1 Tax=Clitoria ternatea TaxID=43366 RepID=A0AAN9PT42_CLITE
MVVRSKLSKLKLGIRYTSWQSVAKYGLEKFDEWKEHGVAHDGDLSFVARNLNDRTMRGGSKEDDEILERVKALHVDEIDVVVKTDIR